MAIVLACHATKAGGIDYLESIPGLLKNFKLRALRWRLVQGGGQPHICLALSKSQHHNFLASPPRMAISPRMASPLALASPSFWLF
jgi:hypothetical protein